MPDRGELTRILRLLDSSITAKCHSGKALAACRRASKKVSTAAEHNMEMVTTTPLVIDA